jgi:hypothetical protein
MANAAQGKKLTARQQRARAEAERLGSSVFRCIQETPGQTAEAIARRLNMVSARDVRERIRELRDRGASIVTGDDGKGYYDLDLIEAPQLRAGFVRAHRERTRAYLVDAAKLMKQIGQMSGLAIAQGLLFNLLVPEAEGEAKAARPATMEDLAKLPEARRTGVLALLVKLLEGIERDPVAYATERALLADRFGRIFITRGQAAAIARAKQALEEVGV